MKRWIKSWLLERPQSVVMNGAGSSAVQVESEVPQGTVLGPFVDDQFRFRFRMCLNEPRLSAKDNLVSRTFSLISFGMGKLLWRRLTLSISHAAVT